MGVKITACDRKAKGFSSRVLVLLFLSCFVLFVLYLFPVLLADSEPNIRLNIRMLYEIRSSWNVHLTLFRQFLLRSHCVNERQSRSIMPLSLI